MLGKRIGIVGAGIGGLSVANALIQKGFIVKVFDKAAKFVPTAGAGFGFSPNGQICLASLGLGPQTQSIIYPFDRMIRLEPNGQIKQETSVLRQLREKIGFSIGGCARADLVDILLAPLKEQNLVHYSHNMTNISQDANRVVLDFEGRPSEEFDLVIGADGIHSRVAEVLDIDHSPPVFSGANIFYGILNNGLESLKNPVLHEPNCVIQSSGCGEFIVFRCGGPSGPIGVWAATYPASTPPKRNDWDHAETNKELQALLPSFESTHPIHELAANSQDRLLHFGLFYRKHKKEWSKGRVCLLGDSCHATLPYVGQGANQAIEDGIVLSNCLRDHASHTKAFEEYYRLRYNRTKRVVRMAGIMDKLYHSQNFFVKKLMEAVLSRVMSGGLIYKQLEKEIVDHCPVQDYAKYRT